MYAFCAIFAKMDKIQSFPPEPPAMISSALTPAIAAKRRRQAGAIGGLTDTALAVVVGSLALIGVVGFFQSSSSGAKTNSEIANFTALVGSIRTTYYQAGSTYAGISAANLVTARIAPQPLIRNDTLMSMSGRAITVAADSDTSRFILTYANIPRESCVKLLTTVSSTMSDIVQISIGSTALATFPVTVANATTACDADTQNIAFTLN